MVAMIKKYYLLHSTLRYRYPNSKSAIFYFFFTKKGKNIEFEEHVFLLTSSLPFISEIPVKNNFLVTLTIVLKKRKLLCNYCTLQITQKFVKKLDCMSRALLFIIHKWCNDFIRMYYTVVWKLWKFTLTFSAKISWKQLFTKGLISRNIFGREWSFQTPCYLFHEIHLNQGTSTVLPISKLYYNFGWQSYRNVFKFHFRKGRVVLSSRTNYDTR